MHAMAGLLGPILVVTCNGIKTTVFIH